MDNSEIAVYFSTFHCPPLIHFSNFQCSKAQGAFQAAPSGGWERVLSLFLIFGIITTVLAMPGKFGWLVLSFADTILLRLRLEEG
jgi:hypothetical protein